jgi:Ca2+-binding RTX toxin-like protein
MPLFTGTDLDNLLTGTAGDDTILGLGGNDQLNGLAGNDSIEGGDGGDVINAGDGADTVLGGDGADVINAGAGVDTVLGGAGADSILGGSDNDSLDGGAGNDTISGEAGNDTITGGTENDSLYGGDGNDSLSGGDGNDRLEGNAGNDTLLGEAGNDTIYGNAGNDSSVGGDGADYLEDSEGINTASGGAGNDTIYGAGVIDGGADNDTLNYYTDYVNGTYVPATVSGGDGNDLIQPWGNYTNGTLLDGGAGNDTINGSGYNESILGGSGNDSLNGQGGSDSIDGGTGDDTINGGAGNDTIDGGDGANIAIYTGNRSQYSVVGDATGLTLYDNRGGTPDGVDVVRNVGVLRFSDQDVSVESGLSGVLLEGTPGDDPALIGTILNDTIRGLAGNDFLSGLAGNDLLEGGDGNDTLQGGSGDDTIDGGTGLNRAIFAGNRADYSVSPNGGTLNGTTTVVDLQPAISGNDGTDVLTGVRLLQFLDQLYAINTPPLAVADSATTLEDTAISISLASLIANDSDAEGDPLSITGFSAVTNGTASISGGNLFFTPATNFDGTGVVTYTLSDGFTTTPGTLSITVTSVNDAPSGADKTITVLEDSVYNFTAADFGFSDPADAAGASGTNSLLSVIFAGSPGQEIPVASLHSLTFTPEANDNGINYASGTFQVRDNGGTANGGIDIDPTPNTIRFDVTPVNDAPAGINGTIIAAENSTYTFTAADFGFTDPIDAVGASGANTLQSVIITTLPAAGTLRLGGTAISAGQEIAAVSLGTLTFTPAPNVIGTGYASFSFQVRDNGGTANGGIDLDPTPNTISINVTPINQPPAGSDKTITFLEDSVYTFSAADFGFTDPIDASRPSGANSLQSVIITTLPVTGSLRLAGLAVTAAQEILAANLASLTYTPAANANGNAVASFTFQVRDNGGTAGGGIDLDPTPNTITVSLTPVNDAPVGTDKTITTLEDTAYSFTAADFGFSDPADAAGASGANTLQSVILTTLPGTGTLRLGGAAVFAGQEIAAASLGSLTYTPAANTNGSAIASFSFQVRDTGGTANGGINLDPTANTIRFDVTPVNDPGVISLSSNSYIVNEEAGIASITLVRSSGFDGAVSVVLTPTNGTASAPADYTSGPITVSFADGEISKTVTIPIVRDGDFEFYETVYLSLSNPIGGATLGDQITGRLVISPNLTLNGNASHVYANLTPALRLTYSLWQSGSAFLTNRISLDNNASFSTAFQFQISNPQGSSDVDGQGADGLVFVVQTVANTSGGGGGGIGYEGISPSLGVEFDTWNNGYVDGNSGNHVGININGIIHSVLVQSVPTRLNNGQVWTSWVDYNGKESLLEVRLASTNQRPDLLF